MTASVKPLLKLKKKASKSWLAPPNLGRAGEARAARYLSQAGYQVLCCNFRAGHDELDLVALTPDRQELVFVEVKTRRQAGEIDPATSVSAWKRFKLRRAIAAYLRRCGHWYPNWRLDVITLAGHRLRHYRNVTW